MEAQRLVQEKMIPREMKMNQITDATQQWKLRVQKDIRELNPNPYIINVKNGLYNVLEDTLAEHNPDYCSTVQLGVTYNKDAKCPRFLQFLKESMGGDMDSGDARLFPNPRELGTEMFCHRRCGRCRKVCASSSLKRHPSWEKECVKCILAGSE